MKKLSQLAFTLIMIISLSLITGANTASAQSGDSDNSNNSCVTLDNNMRYRMRDSSVNNEVSDLQDYLIAEGYLTGNTTGYFGVATLKAVKSFQSQNSLISSGYVGPVTRAKIKSLSCDTASASPVIPSNPVVITPSIPGMLNVTYYYLNSNKDRCGTGTFVGNTGPSVSNGQYVYQTGQYKTEAECKSANGLSYSNSSGDGSVYVTYYKYNTVYKMCTENIYMGNTGERVSNGQYIYRTGEYRTEQECKSASGLSSNPTGIMCTMEARMCPDGSTMYRDANCGWHAEMCKGVSANPAISSAYFDQNANLTFTGSGLNTNGGYYVDYKFDCANGIGCNGKLDRITYSDSSKISFGLDFNILNAVKGNISFRLNDRNGNAISQLYTLSYNNLSTDISFSLLTLTDIEKGNVITSVNAGSYANVCWKSGAGNQDQVISFGITSLNAQKGDGGAMLGSAYLSQKCFSFIIPKNLKTDDYIVTSNNQAVTLYSNSPSFRVVNTIPDPVINSFSINDSQNFSLSISNYSSVAFKAECGSGVGAVQTIKNGYYADIVYLTGSESICNDYQYYQQPQQQNFLSQDINNQPLSLFRNNTVDGSRTYILSPQDKNINGDFVIKVKVCNIVNKCVEAQALGKFYAKG